MSEKLSKDEQSDNLEKSVDIQKKTEPQEGQQNIPNLSQEANKKDDTQQASEIREDIRNLERKQKPDANYIASFLERATEIVEDINGLPLSVDPAFEGVGETVTKNLDDWGEVLFNQARSTEGRNKSRYAQALLKMNYFVSPERYAEMLQGLLTNIEAVNELYEQGLREMGIDPEKERERLDKEQFRQDLEGILPRPLVPVFMTIRKVSSVIGVVKNFFVGKK
ncbi:MAG: hypothetical protein A2556_00845 [Candidatus Vogelbacteria bacterium RIFOXYD2_FULL_44_9]|uniref:Uncharacterized protein n=1 Tax=Candidatus Vogelbacteria bacterium RIFOXYD2_FULL_44_9 TaxID=1802441 RepID=A0A1G2QJH0_9BACT|nr:MAG: hypothetical protein A2556_00845 [Candidatus Vogelbacteria bacterium RIFOXYD2_FULL_44_9]